MSKFIATNRSNDCPVCGDTSGRCKTKDDSGQTFALCVIEKGAKKFDTINGWKCVGEGDSRWATFTVDSEAPQKTDEERQQYRQQREAEERARFMGGLPAGMRSCANAHLLSQLTLDERDRADLKRRRLPSPIIDTLGSVSPWQRLEDPVHPKTPGVGREGSKLNTKYSGYLVPAFDIDAQIQGFQIRNRDLSPDAPKYPWLSTHSNPANLQNGELPLTFARGSVQPEGKSAYLAEGLLKPLVASFTLGISVIGASGGLFASSPKQLKQWLERLNPSELILCPDGGAIANPHVMREYSKLNDLLIELGYSLKVQWWGQGTKAGGDIDEISVEQFEQSSIISWEEFKAKDVSQPIAASSEEDTPKKKRDRPLDEASQLDKTTAGSTGHRGKANKRIAKLRAACESLSNQALTSLRESRDSAIAKARSLCKQEVEAGKDKELARKSRESAIAKARDIFSHEHESKYKPLTERLRSRCDKAIKKVCDIRDRKLAEEDRAQQVKRREVWLTKMAEISGANEATRDAINDAFMHKQLLVPEHKEGTYKALPLASDGGRVMYLLDGQKATRKTSIAIKSLVNKAIAAGQTCLVVVPSRLLSKDAARVLGIVSHLDKDAASARYLVTCPESLHKFANQHWDVVILDEVNEDIKRTFDGSLGVHPELCQRATKRILEKASTIAIANDQMYRCSVAAVQRLGKITPQEIKTIQRRRPPAEPYEMTINLYMDCIGGEASEDEDDIDDIPAPNDAYYGWLGRLVEAIERGERVAVPCGSQSKARGIHRVLRAHFKGKQDAQGRRYKGQVLDGPNTPKKVKSEFAASPDAWLARIAPNWLIWTPCFNSGVSIESTFFTAQFECISVFEGANAASQRGERVRNAIGGGNISERHVFISNRGLPAYPDPQIFTAAYWENLAKATIAGRTEPTDRAIARSIGAEKVLKDHSEELLNALSGHCELFEYWAIEARELYFKVETLQAEWQANGWELFSADISNIDIDKWRGAVQAANQSVIESKSRALAKARPVPAEDQDLSPCAAVRAKKHHLGEQLGAGWERLKDAKWIEAWSISPDASGGIKAQRINTLVKMSVEAPELWASVLKLDTMRTIAAGAELENLPALPIPAKEIAIARLLIRCPGIVDVVTGKLAEWDKTKTTIKNAANYLKAHAQRLATLSQHKQRILGFQFNETTPLIKCFHKALQMAGLTVQPAGRTKKLWRYRLQAEEDCQKKIDKKIEKGEEPRYSDLRDLFRSESINELRERLDETVKAIVDEAAGRWQAIACEIASMCKGEVPTLLPQSSQPTSTESDTKDSSQTKVDPSLLEQLAWWCSDAESYNLIRIQAEQKGLNFERDLWQKLSIDRQKQIYSYFEQAA